MNEEMRSAVKRFATAVLPEKGAFLIISETNGNEVLGVMTFLVRKYDEMMTV